MTTNPLTPQPADRPVPPPEPTNAATKIQGAAGLVVAAIWLVIAIIVGLVLIFGAEDVRFGADAYTEMQNTMADAVRGIGWLIIGSGVAPLALILTLRAPAETHKLR